MSRPAAGTEISDISAKARIELFKSISVLGKLPTDFRLELETVPQGRVVRVIVFERGGHTVPKAGRFFDDAARPR